MCFSISLTKFREYAEKRYEYWNSFNQSLYDTVYYTSAFTRPIHPVVVKKEDKVMILPLKWGLIPFWVKSLNMANKIISGTFNAMAETIFEKPSFRSSIKYKRCLIPVTGFFEWHDFNNKKYPFYISLKSKEPFSLAGIWDCWINPDSNEEVKTFSIITTEANPLLEKIHNAKKRMPVILKYETEKSWLIDNLDQTKIAEFLKSFPESELEAYSVSNIITKKGVEHNVSEVINPFEYKELDKIFL